MSIALAIITWKKPNTLRNTLQSYKDNGLLDICSQLMLWCNERNEFHDQIGEEFGFEVYGGPNNVGAGYGFVRLGELCRTDYIMCLEHDFVLVESGEILKKELDIGIKLLENNEVDTVRYRHRKNHGVPLYSEDLRGKETYCYPLLLESVFFRDDPSTVIYEIKKHESGAFITEHSYSMYTNNPVLYRTKWFYEKIVLYTLPSEGRLYDGFELFMAKKWNEIKPIVSHVPIGLFSHVDLAN